MIRSRFSKHKPRIFKVPALKTSKNSYLKFGVQFLWCCPCALEDGAETPLTFDIAQRDALRALEEFVNRKKSLHSKADVIDAMYMALYMLYFPEDNTALAENVFASPKLRSWCFNASTLTRAIGPYGIFLQSCREPSARCEYIIRGARYLRTTLDEQLKYHNEAKQKPWFECAYSHRALLTKLTKLLVW